MRLALTQDMRLPSGASTGEATLKHGARGGIAGQSHGRIVVARSVPEILSAGEPRRIATSISPHSVRRSMSRKRRLGDCLQMMVSGQEKSRWAGLSAPSHDYSGCR